MFKNCLYFIISILILFPYPIDINVKGYPLSTSYILMLIIFIFMPVILTKGYYWKLNLTKLIWMMRIIFITIFLIASFEFGLSSARIVSFIGYFMISFLYETAFIFNIQPKKFFKIFNIIFLFVLIYATCIAGYFIISTGSLMYNTASIRDLLFLYPNHFSILLILVFWIRQYFVEKHSILIDIWITILIFVFLSRVAIASFLISFIVNILISNDIDKWKKAVSLILVLSLFIPASIYFMGVKEQSVGSTMDRTYYSRVARWEAAFEYIKLDPIIGSGFDRTTDVVSSYQSINGQQAELGSMHNDYLDLLVKGGVLGLISFFAVFIGIFITGFKYNKSLVVLALTIMLTALFQNPIKTIPIMFCLFFTLGAIVFNKSRSNLNNYP